MRSSISTPRATIISVAGTLSRSASRTALRPETISPLGISDFGMRAAAGRFSVDFSARFFAL